MGILLRIGVAKIILGICCCKMGVETGSNFGCLDGDDNGIVCGVVYRFVRDIFIYWKKYVYVLLIEKFTINN